MLVGVYLLKPSLSFRSRYNSMCMYPISPGPNIDQLFHKLPCFRPEAQDFYDILALAHTFAPIEPQVDLLFWTRSGFWLFKRWIMLSISYKITIQRMAWFVLLTLIHWTAIYWWVELPTFRITQVRTTNGYPISDPNNNSTPHFRPDPQIIWLINK